MPAGKRELGREVVWTGTRPNYYELQIKIPHLGTVDYRPVTLMCDTDKLATYVKRKVTEAKAAQDLYSQLTGGGPHEDQG